MYGLVLTYVNEVRKRIFYILDNIPFVLILSVHVLNYYVPSHAYETFNRF